MKRLAIQGRLLILLMIAPVVYGQNQIEKNLISRNVNQEKLHSIIDKEEKNRDFQERDVERLKKMGYKEFIDGEDGSYSQLVGADIWGQPVYLQTMNQNIVHTLGADVLHYGFDGFFLTGSEMVIGLWEPASPRLLHEILRENSTTSRIIYAPGQVTGSGSNMRHATHNVGTLIGRQTNLSSTHQDDVKGVANGASIHAYDWNMAISEMAQEALNGLLVANTSYGFNATFLDKTIYGQYSVTSRDWDAVMCAAPYLQIVRPAGNARDDSPYIVPQVLEKDGFDLLESSGTSKNVLVVSAFDLSEAEPAESNPVYNLNDVEVPYASWGPTDDGRIKPDITAHGQNVLSSIETSNSGYGLLSGTSMATAGVSGAITLLQQYYFEKFGSLLGHQDVPYLWSSTIRALIIHTADEAGDPGPDYKYGWGAMNALSAAKIIEKRGKSTIIREETLENHSEFKLNIVSNGYEPLVVTLAWTDPEGEVDEENPPVLDDTTSKLVNDLDIQLVRMDTNGVPTTVLDTNGDNLLLPWKRLEGTTTDVSQLNSRATRGVNNVDNIEKIEIPVEYLPESGGEYRIIVSHKGNLTDNCSGEGQNFSLIVSGVAFCGDTIGLFQHQDDVPTEYEEGLHVKADNITASNVLEPVSDPNSSESLVKYEAASWIELVPQDNVGFIAEYGSNFLAYIDCQLEVSKAFSSRELNSMRKSQIADENLPMDNSVVIYPNPVINSFLNIQFELNETSAVEIILYNVHGIIVQDIRNKVFEKGKHKQVLDLSTQPKGIYVVKVLTAFDTYTQKIIKK